LITLLASRRGYATAAVRLSDAPQETELRVELRRGRRVLGFAESCGPTVRTCYLRIEGTNQVLRAPIGDDRGFLHEDVPEGRARLYVDVSDDELLLDTWTAADRYSFATLHRVERGLPIVIQADVGSVAVPCEPSTDMPSTLEVRLEGAQEVIEVVAIDLERRIDPVIVPVSDSGALLYRSVLDGDWLLIARDAEGRPRGVMTTRVATNPTRVRFPCGYGRVVVSVTSATGVESLSAELDVEIPREIVSPTQTGVVRTAIDADEVAFESLAAGPWRVTARGTGGAIVAEKLVTVGAGEVVRWTIGQ
jgi:hypothetical protein